MFVDANGGSCTRSASRVAYSDGAACGSLDAANDKCQAGDVVLIKGGTYGNQSISGSNGRGGMCTLEEASGETATTGSVYVSSAAWVTLRGITTSQFGSENPLIPTSQKDIGVFNSANVLIENNDMGGFNISGTEGNVTYRGNDIGPCDNYDSTEPNTGNLPSCTNGKINASDPQTRGVTIENNSIHDFRCDQRDAPNSFTNGIGDDDCHWECMWVNASIDTTIRGNQFAVCDATAQLFLTMFSTPTGYQNLTVENNWFGTGGSTAYGVASGHCENFGGTDYSNVKIRFNVFADNKRWAWDGNCSGTIAATGNVLFKDSYTDCGGSTISWAYNIFVIPQGGTNGSCGTNKLVYGSSINGLTVNPTSNFHLAGAAGSTMADNYVPASVAGGCPATDIDGKARATSGACDAGADER